MTPTATTTIEITFEQLEKEAELRGCKVYVLIDEIINKAIRGTLIKKAA